MVKMGEGSDRWFVIQQGRRLTVIKATSCPSLGVPDGEKTKVLAHEADSQAAADRYVEVRCRIAGAERV